MRPVSGSQKATRSKMTDDTHIETLVNKALEEIGKHVEAIQNDLD